MPVHTHVNGPLTLFIATVTLAPISAGVSPKALSQLRTRSFVRLSGLQQLQH